MKLSNTFSKWLFEFALRKEQRENYSYSFVEKLSTIAFYQQKVSKNEMIKQTGVSTNPVNI